MIKPIKKPRNIEMVNEETTILKKYAQARVAKSQVASTLIPIIL
jgi:hypothetical protein